MKNMKIIYGVLVIAILAILAFAILNKNNDKVKETADSVAPLVNNPVHSVKVVDFANASNYTYLKVSENGSEYWIAVNKMDVKKGEELYFSKSMEMKNFHSKELNKTFDKILFVDGISKGMESGKGQFIHPQLKTSEKADVKVKAIKDGYTVKEIYAEGSFLNGKTVKIRGKVVKVNNGIMDRNWIHIQDGTNYNGKYDLLITTNDNVKVGDVISFEGTVATNKDFGAGYSYKAMIENGKVLKGS